MLNKEWWKESTVYQIYVPSFCDSNDDGIGDLQGIKSKVNYLARLGVEVIWLTPIYSSPMIDNGYDIANYREINEMFGTMRDFEELIAECSNYNIKVILDVVFNHTSDKHHWFQEALKGEDNKYHNYYIWSEKPNDLESIFAGSAWTYVEHLKKYYCHLFAKEQPDLNWENPELRQELANILNFWISKGVSGFRLDVIDLVGKDIQNKILANGPNLHKFLKELRANSWKDMNLLTVGECWSANLDNVSLYTNPDEKELSMVFQFAHMMIDFDENLGKWKPKKFDLLALKKVVSDWHQKIDSNSWIAWFWANHDLPRIISRWGNDKELRVKSAQCFAVLLFLLRGTPFIYQGEEIGMTNINYENLDQYNDVEIHNFYRQLVEKDKKLSHNEFIQAVYKMARDNARTPMQWNANNNAGFSNASPWLAPNNNYHIINVDNELNNDEGVFALYQILIKLRKQTPFNEIITDGSFELLFPEDKTVFAYVRKLNNMEIVVICNLSNNSSNELEYNLDNFNIIYNNYNNQLNNSSFRLLPWQSIILTTVRYESN